MTALRKGSEGQTIASGAFLDWKARQGRRAQPEGTKDSNGGGSSKQRQSKARVDDDDSDAKPTQKKAAGAACADDAKPTPLVPFVADAYVKKDRGLLDRCVEFYTNDPDLRQELEQLFRPTRRQFHPST